MVDTTSETLDDELAEYEAKAAARKDAKSLRDKQNRLAALKLVSKLEESHGTLDEDFAIIQSGDALIGIRKPNLVEYKSYMAKVEEGVRHEDTHQFARSIVISPKPEEFDGIAVGHPGIVIPVANEAMRLAKLVVEDRRKKS